MSVRQLKTRVLHGKGTPRIVIPESSEFARGKVLSVYDKYFLAESISKLNVGLLNRQIIGKNKFNKETRAKIIGFNKDSKKIIVDKWNNEPLKSVTEFTVKNEVVDLPFTEELLEFYEILFKPTKRLWKTKKKVMRVEGFYYNCILNYESYIVQRTLAKVQNVFSSKRSSNFIFIPRSDNERIFYNMELSEETTLEMAQLKFYQGHKYVKFQFSGVDLLDKPNLRSTLEDKYYLASADGTIVIDESGYGVTF